MNNSLAEVHPELITEWSEKNLPLTPDDITFGSSPISCIIFSLCVSRIGPVDQFGLP